MKSVRRLPTKCDDRRIPTRHSRAGGNLILACARMTSCARMASCARMKNFRLALGAVLAGSILLVPGMADAALIRNSNPANTNLEDIRAVLVNLINYLLAFAAGIGALFVLVSGYQYILAAGNPEKLEKAKGGLTWSIVGFILAVSAFAIVYLIQRVFGSKTTVRSDIGSRPVEAAGIITNLIDLSLKFAAAAAVLFLILGGYRYITSGSNSEHQEKAKMTVLYSVIGLVVSMLAYTIFRLVRSTLSG